MDIFKLAELQLQREGKSYAKNRIDLFFDRAETIGKYLSKRKWGKKLALKRKLKEEKIRSKNLTFKDRPLVKIDNR